MSSTKRKWDFLTKERRDTVVKETIAYFIKEHEYEIGVIAAEDILDFFLRTIGSDIYGKGVGDSKVVVKQSFENVEVDLDLLLGK
jgi:uncharacterized protein (DUF2164 family)